MKRSIWVSCPYSKKKQKIRRTKELNKKLNNYTTYICARARTHITRLLIGSSVLRILSFQQQLQLIDNARSLWFAFVRSPLNSLNHPHFHRNSGTNTVISQTKRQVIFSGRFHLVLIVLPLFLFVFFSFSLISAPYIVFGLF